MKTKIGLVFVMVMSLIALPACREKGPAEKAGEKIDKAVDDVKDKTKEAADKIEDKVKE
jgi:predicted small lipoprotein YifL